MMRTNSDYQQDYCVRGIEGGGAIDLSTRDDFLFALVGAIRVLPAHCRNDLIRAHRGKWTSIDMMIANAPDFVRSSFGESIAKDRNQNSEFRSQKRSLNSDP